MSERGEGEEPGAGTGHCSFMGEIKAAWYYTNLPKCCSTPSPPAATRSLELGAVDESEVTRSGRFGH